MSGMAYRALDAHGVLVVVPGKLAFGGNRRDRIYGTATCPAANRAIERYRRLHEGAPRGSSPYERHRVWFVDEAAAIANGYRPCGTCLPDAYRAWRAGPRPGVPYPWRRLPPAR